MITGIILAGGKSKRLGTNKMEVLINNKRVIEHTITNMIEDVDFVTLVTGHYKVHYLKPNEKIKIINNKDYEMGMFTSIKKGIKGIKSDVFIIPGDYPMVKPDTYKAIINGTGSIRVPTYKGRRGHPIYISEELIKDLQKEPLTSNLKVWRDKHTVQYIEVNDQGVILDLDTINDYQKLIEEMRAI